MFKAANAIAYIIYGLANLTRQLLIISHHLSSLSLELAEIQIFQFPHNSHWSWLDGLKTSQTKIRSNFKTKYLSNFQT